MELTELANALNVKCEIVMEIKDGPKFQPEQHEVTGREGSVQGMLS